MLQYKVVAAFLNDAESTAKKNEIVQIIAELIKKMDKKEIKKGIYLLKGRTDADYKTEPLGIAESLVIKTLSLLSGETESEVEAQYHKTGDLGTVAEFLCKKKRQNVLFSETLTIDKVYSNFKQISTSSGKNSQNLKIKYLLDLLSSAEPLEAKYIVRTVIGKLRLGMADMILINAIAKAFIENSEEYHYVERGYNLTMDIGYVSEVLASEGINGLKKIEPEPGIPIRVMLAERAETIEEIVTHIKLPAVVEYKYDGLRLQMHLSNGNVYLYSRGGDIVTEQYPEIVEAVKKEFKTIKNMIVDGELVPVDAKTGKLMPFQQISRRRGRKYDILETSENIPVQYFVFDILYYNDQSYIDKPFAERRKVVLDLFDNMNDKLKHVNGIIASSIEEIYTFFENAVNDNCEGVIVKSISDGSVYDAGARGWLWIKYKKDYTAGLSDTVDLVIVGAFFGHGKRSNLYGAFLLACYNKENGTFETACKVGTGFNDEDLMKFTELMNKYLINYKDEHVISKIETDVWFLPEVVIEVTGAEITVSPNHTCGSSDSSGSGFAIRFPRYTGRLREDKRAVDATTTEEIVKMYGKQ